MKVPPPFEPLPYFDQLGRRGALRIHVVVPAKLIGVAETRDCTLIDISRTGARIRLSHPIAVGSAAYLRIGQVQAFAIAVRVRSEEDGGINGLAFDEPLSRQELLSVRDYARNFEFEERRAAFLAARAWVTGGR